MYLSNPLITAVGWSAATVGLYLFAKVLHRKFAAWWSMPLVLTPALLLVATFMLGTNYQEYIRGTHWLVLLLGPATVAFAIPIFEQRRLIQRHWPVLLTGVLIGSTTAMISAWALASVLGLDDELRLSLLPRSMSTPFAMTVSGDIGGVPSLTAVFVVITGIFGATIGEFLLIWMPIRTTLARGALFGMGAHGVGVAKAHQIGREEGSIAGVVMVLVGLCNVLAAPILADFLR